MKWRWVSASGGGLVAGTGLLWGDESLITRGTRGSQCVVLCCLPVVAESESSEILNGFSFHCKHKEGVRVKRGGQRRSTPKNDQPKLKRLPIPGSVGGYQSGALHSLRTRHGIDC